MGEDRTRIQIQTGAGPATNLYRLQEKVHVNRVGGVHDGNWRSSYSRGKGVNVQEQLESYMH